MLKKTFVSALLLIAAFVFSARSAQAQLDPPGEPKFKVGDRVEFDKLEAGDPSRAVWVKATVVRIEVLKLGGGTLIQTSYVIRTEGGGEVSVTRRHAEHAWGNSGFLRPLAGGNEAPPQNGDQPANNATPGQPNAPNKAGAPNIENAKLRMDAKRTVLADRELIDCDKVESGPAVNGQRPHSEMVKQLIRCLWEQPSKPGQDGAQKVDILQLTPGPSHRWDRLVDMGSGATIDTIVYTFRVKYNVESFYHTYNRLDQNQEAIFSCFVGVGKWQCGYYQRISDGETKRIAVTQ
jgi:hypothetical protein